MKLSADIRAAFAAASISFKSEREFARASHIPRTTINDIIHGRTNKVSDNVVDKFNAWRRHLGEEKTAIIKEGTKTFAGKSPADIKAAIKETRKIKNVKYLKKFLKQSKKLEPDDRARFYLFRILYMSRPGWKPKH